MRSGTRTDALTLTLRLPRKLQLDLSAIVMEYALSILHFLGR